MTRLSFSTLFLLFVWNLAAQQPGFNRLYDEVPGNNIGNNVLTVSDGYYVSGTTVIDFRYHQFLTKLDITGNIEWQKTYAIDSFGLGGGRTGALLQTFEGNLAMCGELIEPDTSPGAYILVASAAGDSLWHFKQKQFGSYEFSSFYAICQTADSGFVAVGFARDPIKEYDLFVAKISKQGTLEWYQTYGNNDWQAGGSIVESDDGFYVGGAEWSGADSDPFLLRLDGNGNQIWRRDFDNSGYSDGGARLFRSTAGHVFVGSFWVNEVAGNFNIGKAFIAKVSEDNDLIWSSQYGTNQIGDGVVQIRENRKGNLLVLSPSQFKNDEFGGLVGWVLELSPDGDSLFETRYNAAYNNDFEGISYAWSLDTTLDGGFITGGFVQGEDTVTNENFQNLWVVKFDSNGCFDSTFNCGPPIDTTDTIDGISSIFQTDDQLQIWPNPASNEISIESSHKLELENLEIFDIQGKSVLKKQVHATTANIDISGIKSGVYFCSISYQNGGITNRKIIVSR